ncbi:MAG: hypothetical protein ABIK39_06825, partial [candidate division WOR-3 bacterium]
MLIFALITLIGLIIISLLSFRWALFFYLITALVFPVLKIGEFAIRIELIYSLWLIILFVTRSLVFKNQKVNFQWRPIILVYALFLTALLFSTLLLLFTGGSSAISKQSLIPFYGFIRPLLIMLLFRNTQFTERWLNRLLTTFVVLSIPISILSICQTLGLDFAQDLTLRCYASPWRTSLPVVKSQYGYLLRSTGVFEYHGYNATFSLTVILITGYLLIKEPVLNFNLRRKRNLALLYTSLVLSTIAGLFSVSVTFLLGVAVVLLLLALSSRTSPRGLLKFSTIMAIVIGAILIFVAPVILKSSNLRQGLLNQIGRIIDGNFLKGRYYLPSAGILAPTYEAITRRPLFGYGFGEGFFSGNSLYVGLLYRGGIIGLGLWFFFIATTLKFTYRHSGLITRLIFFLTILYLAIGLGNPAFFIPRLSEWYWALIGLSGSLMVGSFTEKHRQLRVLHIIPDLKKGGAE